MKLRYGTPEEAGMSAERISYIARLAESWIKDGITPALVVLAARRGVIALPCDQCLPCLTDEQRSLSQGAQPVDRRPFDGDG